jgi:hypothetical protein
MTRIIVSTIRRHCSPIEPSGYIYTVDLDKSIVLQKSSIVEPAFREMDDNPRGGLRGGKGIAVRDDQIALANSSMIFRYDPDWNYLSVISHPSCAAIHDITFHDETLWVAAARTDMVMQFNLEGELIKYFYLRDRSNMLENLGWTPKILIDSKDVFEGRKDFRDPRTHVKETYDRSHTNSIAVLASGDLLVSMGFVFGSEFANLLRIKNRLMKSGVWVKLKSINREIRQTLGRENSNVDNTLIVRPAKAQSAIVRISTTGERSLIFRIQEVTAPSHSCIVLPDQTAIYLNTTQGIVIHFEPLSGNILTSNKVTEGFLRGVTSLSNNLLLLGTLGEVLVYDLSEKKIRASVNLTNDPTESVYDIKVLPTHYALPPKNFEKHFSKNTGSLNATHWIQNHKFTLRS